MAETSGVIAHATDRPRDGFDDPARGNASWVTLFSRDLTPTESLSAGIMELPPNGGCLQPHRHHQPELYYVVAGTGLLTIDGAQAIIATGSAAFIPGDAEHALRNDSAAVLTVFYVFPTDSFAEVVYRFSNTA